MPSLKLFIVCISFICASDVFAGKNECVVGTKIDVNFTIPAISVGRDIPVGTVIGTYYAPTNPDVQIIACDYGNYYYSFLYNGSVPSGTEHVYKTTVEGVGISLTSGSGYTYDFPPHLRYDDGDYGIYNSTPQVLTLIKIGPIVSGQLNQGVIGQLEDTYHNPGMVLHLPGAVPVTQTLCSVKTPSLVFALPDIPASDFGTSEGFTPSASVTRPLELDCDAQANINISLSGTQNPDVSDPSVLALSKYDHSGAATGVGVQLLYNSKPLNIGESLFLKQSSGENETFEITARYYQTKSVVRAGSINSVATLNITYQ